MAQSIVIDPSISTIRFVLVQAHLMQSDAMSADQQRGVSEKDFVAAIVAVGAPAEPWIEARLHPDDQPENM